MFWRLGFHPRSPIESLVENDGCTIQEILDEDDVLQECKSHNEKLIEFLSRKENIVSLIDYITVLPSESDDDSRIHKYPFLSCEILCSDIASIVDRIADDDELLERLFRFLDNEPPLNAVLASYFVRFFTTILQRKPTELLHFARKLGDRVPNSLAEHISTTGMNQVMLQFMGYDIFEGSVDSDNPFSGGNAPPTLSFAGTYKSRLPQERRIDLPDTIEIAKWWIDTKALLKLIEKLDPAFPPEVHFNVTSVLSEIAKRYATTRGIHPLSQLLMSEPVTSGILDKLLKTPESTVFLEGMSLLSVIVESSIQSAGTTQQEEASAILVILTRIKDFIQLLQNPMSTITLPMTSGVTLTPPLGIVRLKVIEFIASLIHTNYIPVEKEILSSGLLNVVLDLFFQYDLNNMLHNLVAEMIRFVFSSPSEILKRALIKDCKLLDRTMETFAANEIAISQPKGVRKGNLGHLTLIANNITRASEMQPYVASLVEDNVQWAEFVRTILTDKNDLETISLGGHKPEMVQPNQQGEEEEEEEEMLDQVRSMQQVNIPDGTNFGDEFDDDEEIEDERQS